ncbi:MAG TPA: SRPBCC family protein [Acidimicrobiales bacterium]|nr:SRPBCC family protein [Acidimicrobiales bacterium]
MSSTRSISVSRSIPAPPSRIFEVLADPRQHALLDGSGSVSSVKHAPVRLALGSTFSMNMKMGLGYVTRNRVVEFEENRRIAWHHFAKFIWRYELEEVDGGTKVTESFDYDRPWAFVIIAMGFPERNRLAMEATLERLEAIVTS